MHSTPRSPRRTAGALPLAVLALGAALALVACDPPETIRFDLHVALEGGGDGTVNFDGSDCIKTGNVRSGKCSATGQPTLNGWLLKAKAEPGSTFVGWRLSGGSCRNGELDPTCELQVPVGELDPQRWYDVEARFERPAVVEVQFEADPAFQQSDTSANSLLYVDDAGDVYCWLGSEGFLLGWDLVPQVRSYTKDCVGSWTPGATVTLKTILDSYGPYGVAFPSHVEWSGPCTGVAPICSLMAAEGTTTVGARVVPGATENSAPLIASRGQGNGAGRVTGVTAGIDCTFDHPGPNQGTGSCVADLLAGTQVSLTAQPSAGSTLESFLFDPVPAGASCSGTTCSYTVVAGQPVIAWASFVPGQTTLRHLDVFGSVLLFGTGTVTSDVGGISCTLGGSSVGTGTCGADLPDGTVVTLTAAPAAGNRFSSWDVQPPPAVPCAAGAATCVVTLTANTTVTAAFDRLSTVRLLVEGATTSGTGLITSDVGGISCTVSGSTVGIGTCSAMVPEGTVVTLTATPDAGSNSPTWEVWSPGAPCAPGPTCRVIMGGPRTVAAGFAAIPTVRLSVSSSALAGSPTGRITSSPAGIDCVPDDYLSPGGCTLDVAAGTVVTLTAEPVAGYAFTSLAFSNGTPDCTASPCLVTVAAATTATATFSALPTWTLKLELGGSGSPGTQGEVVPVSGGESCNPTSCAGPNTTGLPCFCYPTTDTTVVLEARPAAGNTFTWTPDQGCTTIAGPLCTVTPQPAGAMPHFVRGAFQP